MLTPEQVSAFWEDGFVAVPDVLSPAELDALRTATQTPAVARARAAIGGWGHQFNLSTMHPAFWDLAAHPAIVDCVAALVGDDVQVQHTKLATKPAVAGSGPVAWHQDFPFLPHTNTDLVAAFVYLDDATEDNGCMSFVRGSHRLGPLRHHDEATGEATSTCQEPSAWADESRHVALPVGAGGVSFHHCLVVHSSSPNRSGAERRGAVIQYRAADAVQLGGPVFLDTGRQVRGSFRGVARCTLPSVSLPLMREDVLREQGHGYGYGAYDRTRGALASASEAPVPRRRWLRRAG